VTLAPPAAGGREAGGTPRLERAAAPVLAAFDRRRLALLRAAGVPPPARLVDAGAGRGRFVAAARAAGYAADGVEPSARGVAAARERYGVALVRGAIADAPVAAGSVDAVTAWHVLEHLDDPAAALRTVAGWLRPGGVLLAGVPNLGSWQAALGGERWYHLDLARHRVHLTVPGLLALLARTGFAVAGPGAVHHVLAEHNPYGAWQTAVNRATGTTNALFAFLRREAGARPGAVAASGALLPLAPVAAAAELAAGLARRGGTVAVVATRAAS